MTSVCCILGWNAEPQVRIYPIDGTSKDLLEASAGKNGRIMLGNDFLLCSQFGTIQQWKRWKASESAEKIMKIYDSSQSQVRNCYLGHGFVIVDVENQLFYHSRINQRVARSLSLHSPVKFVACGSTHAIIQTDFDFFSLGEGQHGELGLGKDCLQTGQLMKIVLLDNESPLNVAVSINHSVIVTKPSGHVYSFGCGAYYRLGHGNSDENCFSPVRIEKLAEVGSFNPFTLQFSGIKMVACGEWHTLALAEGTNDIYGWGWNKFGQIGTTASTMAEHQERMIDEPERISVLDEDYLLGDDFDPESADNVNEVVSLHCGSTFSCLKTLSNRIIVM
jgi:hypothetical protein